MVVISRVRTVRIVSAMSRIASVASLNDDAQSTIDDVVAAPEHLQDLLRGGRGHGLRELG